jgi:hypothetical protein
VVKPARVARIRSDSTDVTAAPSLAGLNDQEFEQVLLKNAHPPARDAGTWEQLTRPELIDRTKRVLIAMRDRNRRAIHRKNRHLNEFHAKCQGRGEQGRRDWFAAKAEHERWTLAAKNFDHTVCGALDEIDAIRETQANHRGRGPAYRERFASALQAIREHQTASRKANLEPESHDLALWKVLDHLTTSPAPRRQPPQTSRELPA